MAKLVLSALTLLVIAACTADQQKKVVCFYNDKSFSRPGDGKFDVNDLKPALTLCTHLIYGYAGINKDSHEIIALNSDLEISQNNFKRVTDLKKNFPTLKILLSVGGSADDYVSDKYVTLLENANQRTAFVSSAKTFLSTYNFDGLDLAWQFPRIKPKKIRNEVESAWHGFKKIFGSTVQDEKAEEHKQQFTSLVRELKDAFTSSGLILTASVLPNVNSTVYYDTSALIGNLEQVHILAYDFSTPDRNPKQADYPAPLFELIGRDNRDGNAQRQVQIWQNAGAPGNKIILGVPTYGRAWKLTGDSDMSGTPPIITDGPATAGNYTNEPGLLAYYEVCKMIHSNSNGLSKIVDPLKRLGSYAFHNADGDGNHGIWVGYEDTETAKVKAAYVVSNNLGGVAVSDLTLDDFKGLCGGEKYPILNALDAHL